MKTSTTILDGEQFSTAGQITPQPTSFMSLRRYSFYKISLFSFIIGIQLFSLLSHAQQPNTQPKSTITKTIKTLWANQTIPPLGFLKSAKPVLTKRAVYEIKFSDANVIDVPVLAFQNTKTGRVWLGPEMDFYIDQGTNTLGGTVNSGVVSWRNSMVSSSAKSELADSIERFEKEGDAAKLVGSAGQPATTDLRPFLPQWFFYRQPEESKTIKIKIKNAETVGRQLRLDLENPFTHEMAFVQIQIDSLKVVN